MVNFIEKDILLEAFKNVELMDNKWMLDIIQSYIYSESTVVLENDYGNYLVQIFETRFDQKYGCYKDYYYKFHHEEYDFDDRYDYVNETYDDTEYKTDFEEVSSMDKLNKELKQTELEEERTITSILLTECNYILSKDNESVVHGEYKKYDNYHGTLSDLIEYDKGVICGKKYKYFNGIDLELESYYTNGKLNGEYKEYCSNSHSEIIKKCTYKDGKLDGEYKSYLYDSIRTNKIVPYMHCFYKDGEYDGLCVTNYQYINEPWTKTTYCMGKRDGPFIKYFDPTKYDVTSPHKIMCETNYKDDQLHGLHKEYFEDGKLYKEIDYVDGKIHGKYKEYKKGGILFLECDHREGKKHGYLIDHINKQRGLFLEDVQVG